jgi:hypothetical protein
MIRTPARAKASQRQQIARVLSKPAPVGGLNAVDPIAKMPETDAIFLDNWYPRQSYLDIRGGSLDYATISANPGKTLAVYNALSGTNKMFCASNDGIFDVTAGGSAGAAVLARTNGKHQWIMVGDGTSDWLIMVNGVDKPAYYDGTTWTAVDGATTPAITGITSSTIVNLCSYKSRLFFIVKDSLAFYYLNAGVVGGAVTKFDLSGIARKGGFLVGCSTWSVDGGNGPNDRLAFVTSQGEVIVYIGTNPSSAADWTMVGRFEIGRPLGYRSIHGIASDVLVITENGVMPLSSVAQTGTVNYANASTYKIQKLFQDNATKYNSVFGWKMTNFPRENAMILNVPNIEDGKHYQYVINTITSAWCRFTDWDAEDFAVLGNELYFCKASKVVKAWTGKDDNGAAITAEGQTAYSYFGGSSQSKHFKMFRLTLSSDNSISYLADLNVDFADMPIDGTYDFSPNSGSVFGVGDFGSSNFGGSQSIINDWLTPSNGYGYAASVKIIAKTNSATVNWLSCDYSYETGGVL